MSSIDYKEIFEQYYQSEYDFNTESLSAAEIAERCRHRLKIGSSVRRGFCCHKTAVEAAAFYQRAQRAAD